MANEEQFFFARPYLWLARGLAKHQMEGRIAKIITIANGHEASGEPAGSTVYDALLAEAIAEIDKFCAEWKIPPVKVQQQLPMLKHLKRLAEAPAPKPVAVWAILAGAALLSLPVGFAVLHSIYQHAFSWLGGH